MYVHRGDTFFTRSDSWLGRLIRWGETERGETPSWTNHTGVVVKAGHIDKGVYAAEVVEALGHVRRGPLRLNGVAVRVFRPVPDYTEEEKMRLIAEAQSHIGERYGWWKLAGFLIKRATGLDVPRLFFIRDRPICSYLAAWANEAARPRSAEWPGFGMAPQAADPDEMLDFCETHPEFWMEVKS
jgi:hypothetical protein